MESFKNRVTDFEKRLSVQEEKISSALCQDFSSESVAQLQKLVDNLNSDLSSYEATGATYINFLTATKTEESDHLKGLFQSHLSKIQSDVAQFRDRIEKRRQGILEDVIEGVFSKSKHSSKCGSSEMKKKLSKMKAAQRSVEFAQKEVELIKEKARLEQKNKEIEADLLILQKEKAAEELKTEVEILENEGSADDISEKKDSVKLKLPEMDKDEKIKKFFDSNTCPVQSSTVEDFTNYILKKELIFSRITNFNDNPANYQVWKTSFQQVTSDMNINASEEVDLLIKYLGPDSRKHAINLKTVYSKDQCLGLSKIWERLDERYGAPEIVHKLIQKRVEQFSRLTLSDTTKWYELDDLLSEILALKEDSAYAVPLAYYDSSVGLSSITCKLPGSVQEKWATRANRYKREKNVYFPPLKEFVNFIHEQAKIRNDPSVTTVAERLKFNTASSKQVPVVTSRKTEVSNHIQIRKSTRFCPLHQLSHSLNKCRAFRLKSLSERKQFLKDNNICFKCCEFNNHKANECKVSIKCCVCGNVNHPGALHVDPSPQPSVNPYGGEGENRDGANQRADYPRDSVSNSCTQICGASQISKSCAKLVLVNVVNSKYPENIVQCYAMLDEQSNKSLARSRLFVFLQIDCPDFEYTINSCVGTHVAHGRRASDCIVSSVNGSVSYSLPTLIECPDIPNNRNEICSPRDVSCHPRLSHIAGLIPEINDQAEILLLIGRDLVEAHHIRDQILGPPGAPFAQHVGLGWVVIGEMCLGKTHTPDVVNVSKIHVLNNGRPTLFEPCTSQFYVEDKVNGMYDPLFVRHIDDDKPSLSIEDREFLDIMDHGFRKTNEGKWTAPLPFKSPRQRLPNNRSEALRRAKSLHVSLQRNPEKKSHMVGFMTKILVNGHAEVAPVLGEDEECWFLPIFGVYNPKKPGHVRAVFDSSSTFKGVSLNSVLLTGPDLTNSLLGVLMRFRRESVAISADIEQMFYCFEVDEVHRNFLRFFWYEDNDVEKPLIEYRMARHVFGNSPSPAIATYGLRRSVEECDEDIKVFVHNDFYVDDGLTSFPCAQEAVDLLKRTQVALGQSSLRLHKIASNDKNVMRSFPTDGLAKDLKSLDFGERLPTQCSLGLGWDLNADCFVFNVILPAQVISRRKILSTVNSVFDPLGFLAPFTIVPRSYLDVSLSDTSSVELHVFCDASEIAVSAVAYLVCQTSNHEVRVGFVLGKSKVAPKKGHTIPRLELCGAVLAVEIAQTAVDQLQVKLHDIRFYTDSNIVLGYINNHTRRFYTYVANRVEKVRRFSLPKQWNYIPSALNPADVGSRGVSPSELQSSTWLSGPDYLSNRSAPIPEFFPIIDPDQDKVIRPQVNVSATSVQDYDQLGSHRSDKFSSWSKLVTAISILRHLAISHGKHKPCAGYHTCSQARSPDFQKLSESLILRVVQTEFYKEEVSCLKGQHNIPKNSPILTLDPYLDENGVMRVGGRLSKSNLDLDQKHPVIVPGKHYVARLLVGHFHTLVKHQGRQLTEGAVRDAGYWITGGKRLVNSLIYHCVTCKKLRGKCLSQKMSELPVDRVQQSAPFTYVDVDVFGPWSVVTRRTRGGQASSKRWAVLFTCLTIRAVHIEVIDEMSSSAFINALRRFVSLRGTVKQFRSDRGTNFVGATDLLGIDTIFVEDRPVKNFLQSHGCEWVFNPPHSSHMGGSWERMIGIARRVLESMLKPVTTLTHDVLVTLMAEVTAIINSRPIVPVSNDPDNPEVLSPSMLLTSKSVCDNTNVSNLDVKSLYGAQWKRVQYLAELFWSKWKREFLNTLQTRRKWNYEQEPLSVGDVVLLKDKEVCRNFWPLARGNKSVSQ
ncbi:uncharacterized protein LOC123539924 [Mercenaria mercenaria]|uniref:uncharacterized protein LOC123539924 n=1 Tax=Mercenaria mercenaria TaxID=6596 RepID=UPI00234E7029|nr:uncharacterized protein LOC123539924 [Mercenaria mercenaria]